MNYKVIIIKKAVLFYLQLNVLNYVSYRETKPSMTALQTPKNVNANVIMLCSSRVNTGHRHTYLHTVNPTITYNSDFTTLLLVMVYL